MTPQTPLTVSLLRCFCPFILRLWLNVFWDRFYTWKSDFNPSTRITIPPYCLFLLFHKMVGKWYSNGVKDMKKAILRPLTIKIFFQYINQTSASRLNLKFEILTKPSFRISTKIQLHNLYKTSATKYRPNSSFKFCLNFNFKILTKPCAQSLNKSLALWTILSYQICNKLLPIQSSSSTLATVTISTSFELASSHARVTSIKFTKQESVS